MANWPLSIGGQRPLSLLAEKKNTSVKQQFFPYKRHKLTENSVIKSRQQKFVISYLHIGLISEAESVHTFLQVIRLGIAFLIDQTKLH